MGPEPTNEYMLQPAAAKSYYSTSVHTSIAASLALVIVEHLPFYTMTIWLLSRAPQSAGRYPFNMSTYLHDLCVSLDVMLGADFDSHSDI